MSPFRTRSILLGAALAAAALVGAALAADGVEITGKVTRAEKDGTFEVTVAGKSGGAYTVTLAGDAAIFVEAPATLDRIARGSPVHVLGVSTAAQAGKGAKISDIQAVVVGDDFLAPPLDREAVARRRQWIAGKFAVDGMFSVDGVPLDIDRKEFPATLLLRGDATALLKGREVVLAGPATSGKTKAITAKRIRVLNVTGGAEQKVRLAGKVTAVGADGTFQVSASGGTYEIALATTTTPVIVHTARHFSDLADGTQVRLVGHHNYGGYNAAAGAQEAPSISQVQVIVAGDSYVGRSLDPALSEGQKLTWLTGSISKGAGTMSLDGISVQCGLDHIVLVVGDSDPTAIAKGKLVLFEGLRTGDPKSKTITVTATRVDVLAPEVSPAEYKIAFGL